MVRATKVSNILMHFILLIKTCRKLCISLVGHQDTHLNMLYTFVLLSIVVAQIFANKPHKYKPDWKELDMRPLPQWYDEAKVGIFVHWGVYSVPAMLSEWFWHEWITRNNTDIHNYMQKHYAPGFSYQEFAPMFKAELFDPDRWAELFAKSGAKFVVLTSKHHDGYTLFPSNFSPNWNSVDIGPKRDIVQDLRKAVLKQGMKFGLYYSLLEWYNPLYTLDKAHKINRNKTSIYVDQKMFPELIHLIEKYKPSVVWSDGDWAADYSYWRSPEVLTWLYNESPVKDEVVVNDRWGAGTRGRHGDFYNYDDKFNNRTLMGHKWENAFPLDVYSWGYRIDAELRDILTVPYIIIQLVTTVSCGGNILINVGPNKEGRITPIFQDRLLYLGQWLGTNGDAIYRTSPWEHQMDIYNPTVWYTCNKLKYNAERPAGIPSPDDVVTAVYAITLAWPKHNVLQLGSTSSYLLHGDCRVELLGYKGEYLKWYISKGMTYIRFPDRFLVKSEHAWAIKISKN